MAYCKLLQMEQKAMQPDHLQPSAFTLATARMHEVMGTGWYSFALYQATKHNGTLFWIAPEKSNQTLLPDGLPRNVAHRLHLIRPKNERDLLWSIEETLRSSAVDLVIAEPQKPLSLTAGRRMQLAAEKGQTTGLIFVREGQGSNACETRWKCHPLADQYGNLTLHHWQLIRNKRGIIGDWTVSWNGETDTINMVPSARQRYRTQETTDHRAVRAGS